VVRLDGAGRTGASRGIREAVCGPIAGWGQGVDAGGDGAACRGSASVAGVVLVVEQGVGAARVRAGRGCSQAVLRPVVAVWGRVGALLDGAGICDRCRGATQAGVVLVVGSVGAVGDGAQERVEAVDVPGRARVVLVFCCTCAFRAGT
jgi:hypothetical protein